MTIEPKVIFYDAMGTVIPKGTRVYARNVKIARGRTTGGIHSCSLEGCHGQRIAVRWPNKQITFPCTKGMNIEKNGRLRIL